MAQAKLEQLSTVLTRIEKSLDAIEAKVGGGAGAGSASSGSSGSGAPSVAAFESLIEEHLNKLVELGKKISPDVGAISEAYHKAALAIRDLIAKAATTKKPAAGDLPSHLGAAAAAMGEVAKVKDANNRTTKFPNHLSAVAEGTPGMGWVSVEKTPGPFAKENSEPALFYTNRILKDFKGKDETHENWVKAFVGFINAVPAYVKEHHTTGLKWN